MVISYLVEVKNVADLILVVAFVLLVKQELHGALHGAGNLFEPNSGY